LRVVYMDVCERRMRRGEGGMGRGGM